MGDSRELSRVVALVVLSCATVWGGATATLPPGEVGVAYEVSLLPGNAAGTTYCQLGQGTLPDGLTLTPAGLIAGVPTSKCSRKFTVTGDDGWTNKYKLKVCAPVRIATVALKSGRVGTAYHTRLKAKSGVKPFLWSIAGGRLPSGLDLDGVAGTITGTPAAAVSLTVTGSVTDAAGGTDARPLALSIAPGSGVPTEPGPAAQYSGSNYFNGATVIGDLNGDGRNDVVFSPRENGPAVVLLYYQATDGSLEPGVVLATGVTVGGVAIGDVNGDGKADLVVSGSSVDALVGWPGRIVVFYQEPATGQFLPKQEWTVSSTSAGSVAVADLDSDGRNDIAAVAAWTTDPDHGVLAVFSQQADGTLAAEHVYDQFPQGRILRVADLDHDGDNDLVLATGLKEFVVIKQDATTRPGVLSTNIDTYTVETSYWPQYDALEVGDVNADGRTDVVVLDPGNHGYLSIYRQNAAGTLDPPTLLAPWFAPPYGIEIADIDGDGLNDILGDRVDYGMPPQGNVLILYQNADHTFQESVAFSFPTSSGGGSSQDESLAIGDVTGDGRPDAVMCWSNEGVFVLPSRRVPEP